MPRPRVDHDALIAVYDSINKTRALEPFEQESLLTLLKRKEQAATSARWRERNREKVVESRKKYEGTKKHKAAVARYASSFKAKLKRQRYINNHKEEVLAAERARYYANHEERKEKAKLRMREYYKRKREERLNT